MNDTISVIMATYNCAATVEKAIDSILAQTYKNWIMIVCDDGSTDQTPEILHRYGQQYPGKFVILQNKTNRKLPYSLNRCLSHVRTELVARMDGDDWSTPDRLEKQAAFLRSHPEYDLVGTGIAVSDGKTNFGSILQPPEPTKQSMLHGTAFSHATVMTYKRVYDALGGYSTDPAVLRAEDVDLWCRFFAAGFRGYNLPDELYVILEDLNAVKRRTLQNRINEAVTRHRGYRLMGFHGPVCYIPYLGVLKAFVPAKLAQALHNRNLRRGKTT